MRLQCSTWPISVSDQRTTCSLLAALGSSSIKISQELLSTNKKCISRTTLIEYTQGICQEDGLYEHAQTAMSFSYLKQRLLSSYLSSPRCQRHLGLTSALLPGSTPKVGLSLSVSLSVHVMSFLDFKTSSRVAVKR